MIPYSKLPENLTSSQPTSQNPSGLMNVRIVDHDEPALPSP